MKESIFSTYFFNVIYNSRLVELGAHGFTLLPMEKITFYEFFGYGI